MAGAEKDTVVLKLLLDTGLAAKEVTGFQKDLDDLRKNGEKVAAALNNTMGGRLLTSLAGAVSSTVGKVFNEDIPEGIAKAELQIAALQAAVGKVLGPQAGDIAGALARKGFGESIKASQGALGTLQSLQAVFPGTPLDSNDAILVANVAYERQLKVQAASRATLQSFQQSTPGKAVTFNEEALATALNQTGEAVIGAGVDVARGLGGIGSNAAKKLLGLATGGKG